MKTYLFRWLSAITLFVCLPTAADEPTDRSLQRLVRFSYRQPLLGTEIRLKFYAVDEATANRAATAAYQRARELDCILSNYRSDSEVSTLCRSWGTPADSNGAWTPAAIRTGDDLWTVLLKSREINGQSDGAFDVTVGPLARLWKRAIRRGELPRADRLEAAFSLVGFSHLRMGECDQTVTSTQRGVRLDFGGIGKGYIADQLLQSLAESGIERALVDTGGDIVCGAAPPDETGWRVTIASGKPVENDHSEPPVTIRLVHRAIATSGDAFQSATIEGKRYSHLIDPRSGQPIADPPTCSVVARTATEADAWASAFCVLGVDAGRRLAESLPEIEARWIVARCLLQGEADTTEFEATLESRNFRKFYESNGAM